jgi:hypothetical protein
MSSRYVVVSILRETLGEESVNIGVIGFIDGHLEFRFLNDCRRAAKFLGLSTEDVEATCSYFKHLGALWELSGKPLQDISAYFEELARDSQNNVRISPVRYSTRSLSEVVSVVASKVLVDKPAKKVRTRSTKLAAVNIGKDALQVAMQLSGLQQRGYRVVDHEEATIESSVFHTLDYGLRNGRLKIGGFGLSFDSNDSYVKEHLLQISAMATDIRRTYNDMPMCMVAVATDDVPRPTVDYAESLLLASHVDLLWPQDASDWADERLTELAAL